MEGGDSSSLGTQQKAEKCRLAWTPLEEQALANLMKDLVSKGWRSENGFKPGYLTKLANGMKELLPGTDILPNPHITSRITIWKKFHGSLLSMLHNNSGIGFNTTTGIIDCHDDAWKEIVKKDPNATHMRYKAWTLFNDWCEIFGMDKANGGTAEDVSEAVNEDGNHGDDQDIPNKKPIPSDVDLDDGPIDMHVTSETPRSDKPGKSKNGGKRKPAEISAADKLCDVLEKMNKSADVRMESLVHVMRQESSLSTARKDLYNLVDELPDLCDDDKVDVAHILAKNPECLEMFMGMGMSQRTRYAQHLLADHLCV